MGIDPLRRRVCSLAVLDDDDIPPGHYRVESCAVRFMAEPDVYQQSEMLHPKWLGVRYFRLMEILGDSSWTMRKTGTERTTAGLFSTILTNELGIRHRPPHVDVCLRREPGVLVYVLGQQLCKFERLFGHLPGRFEHCAVTGVLTGDACGYDTGRWTWHRETTGENWCHLCHVELHRVEEFACPACNETVCRVSVGEPKGGATAASKNCDVKTISAVS